MALFTTILVALSPLLQPANAAAAVPDPVVSSPTPGELVPQPVAHVPAAPGRGLASWYPMRPLACWDARGPHPLPWGLTAYTASRSLPCGALVTVSGPVGTVTIPVEDFGPEAWTGRMFDLSPAAFEAVAGSLGPGVVSVSWWPAG